MKQNHCWSLTFTEESPARSARVVCDVYCNKVRAHAEIRSPLQTGKISYSVPCTTVRVLQKHLFPLFPNQRLILRDGSECLAIFTRNPSIIISVVQGRTETMRLLFGISLNAKKVVTRIPSCRFVFFHGVNMIRICTFSIFVLFFPINNVFSKLLE